MQIEETVFIAFNSRVGCLDQRTGEIIWSWKTPKGHGYVSVLLDGNRLFVSVQGYTYALDARTGAQLWHNPMKGFGLGVATLASVHGTSQQPILGEASARARRAAAAGGAAGAGS